MNDRQLGHELVDDIVDDLDVSNECRQTAVDLARRTELEHTINRSPMVVAASAVYLASLLVNEKVTQDVVSDAAGVSKPAIRACYNEMAIAEGYKNEEPSKSVQTRRPSVFDRVRGWLS